MKHALYGTSLAVIAALCLAGGVGATQGTNVLFIIADDASHFGATGGAWVKTPNIDRLARRGLIFDNAYTPTGKCSPSRAAILTGRNPWQLEDAANHWPQFPAKFKAFSEALAEHGVAVGGQGKIWGPGIAKTDVGMPRDFGFTKGKDKGNAPGPAFAAFLRSRKDEQPFFYWFGSPHPHRGYPNGHDPDTLKPADISRVPAYLPDHETVRLDLLDYAAEIAMFDEQVGELVAALDAAGAASNTLVIVTSDNGMPFPRSKGHTYDVSDHMPFVACWPAGIRDPGCHVAEFVSFIDLAPTFLDLFGVARENSGLAPITGRSFARLLRGEPDPARSTVILGRERNDARARPGTESGLGYPSRAIRDGQLLYIHNFKPDRWPCGDPDLGLKDVDDGPTKKLLAARGPGDPHWELCFGKRPAEELYDLAADPDCLANLAGRPDFASKATVLREKLFAALKEQADPRILGAGDVFDNYHSPYP